MLFGSIATRAVLRALFPVVVLTFPTMCSVSAQEYSPHEIARGVKIAFASCMNAQRKNPDNVGAPEALLQDYCRCFANKMTARLRRADIAAFERNNELATEDMVAKAQQAGRECQAEISR